MGRGDDSDYDSDDEGSKKKKAVLAWRGLANYRTHMKRMALKRNQETRTSSDLYLLEDIVLHVRFLCDLPMALRLNICKVLGYESHGPGNCAAKQGSKASFFTIIFTGSVKCTYHQLGVQDDKTWIIPAGKWFGDRVLEDWNYQWEYTVETNEKTELLTLTRRDYERVLDIKKTPELRERVSFLKGIERFKTVPRQSLLRLANVLSARSYSKNRIITFQGDDSVEMYFIKSGECRIILEVPDEKLYTPLPRASSFIKQYWPTQYHRCRMNDKDKDKDWWHPSFEKPRPSTMKPGAQHSPRSSRCNSAYSGQLPQGLGAAILRNPDAVFGLVKRRKSKQKRKSVVRHRSSASAAAGGGVKDPKRRATGLAAVPIGGMGEIRTNEDRPSLWGSPRGSVEAMAKAGTLSRQAGVTPPFPTAKKGAPHWPFVGGAPVTSQPAGRYSLMQIHFSDVYGEKRAKQNTYSLRLFLHDCHHKEQEAKLVEFGEKDHNLWQMGLRGDHKMPGIVGEGNMHYQAKFKKWARHIIDREKKLLSYSEVEGSGETSFMPGVSTSEMKKLKKGRGKDGRPQYIRRGHVETSSIIDIGCLKAGEFFGERGLMTASKRAASIVAVTMVDTLVLTKWDFHRHCDRQVLKTFKEIDYQKKKRMFRSYLKAQKWERYKRKVVKDVLEAKACRFNVGPKKIRVLPKLNRTKHELPVKEWLFKSHPSILPSFPNQDPFELMRLTMQN